MGFELRLDHPGRRGRRRRDCADDPPDHRHPGFGRLRQRERLDVVQRHVVFATPYAAGVCAPHHRGEPGLHARGRATSASCRRPQDVTSVESGAGWDRYTGYGMVDAARRRAGLGSAVEAAAAPPPTRRFRTRRASRAAASTRTWTTTAEGTEGRIQVTTANTPFGGQLPPDAWTTRRATPGPTRQNEAWLHLDLVGRDRRRPRPPTGRRSATRPTRRTASTSPDNGGASVHEGARSERRFDHEQQRGRAIALDLDALAASAGPLAQRDVHRSSYSSTTTTRFHQ